MRPRAFAAAALSLCVVGCGDDPVPAAALGASEVHDYEGELAVDIRASASIELHLGDAGALDVRIALAGLETKALFDPSAALSAKGRRQLFPEAGSELFTAAFALPASPSGACGAEPVTLALALLRREPNHRFGGSLTAYCGDKAAGVPARILRLSGDLEPH